MDILMKTPELYPDFVKSEKYISIHSYVKNTHSFQTFYKGNSNKFTVTNYFYKMFGMNVYYLHNYGLKCIFLILQNQDIVLEYSSEYSLIG